MKHRACPICECQHSEILKEYVTLLFDDSPASGEFDLVSCQDCGFVFYDTPTTDAQWAEFYENHYFIRYYAQRESDEEQKALLKRTADFIAPSKDAKVSDIGCGPGHLLTVLKDSGIEECVGVELCSDFYPELESRGIKALEGRAERLPFESNSMDVLCYCHLIEHLMLPRQTLEEIKRCLKVDGLVYVELPDIAKYDGVEGIHPLNQFIFEHINHFDIEHLEFLFNHYGLSLERYERDVKDNMPILRAVFKNDGLVKDLNTRSDFGAANLVKSWCKLPLNHETLFARLKEQETPVHIWGVSYQTLDRLSLLGFDAINVADLYDIDPRKQSKSVKGKRPVDPENLKNTSQEEVILIGVGPSSDFMYSEAIKNNPNCVIEKL